MPYTMHEPARNLDRSLMNRPWKDLPGDVQSRLAVAYIAWIVIGTIMEVMYYGEFGINIIEYSDVFDFLIGPFKRSEAVFFLLFIFAITLLALRFDIFMQKRFPNTHNLMNFGLARRRWFAWYRNITFVIVFFVLLVFYSFMLGEGRRDQLCEQTDFDLAVVFQNEPGDTLQVKEIGANASYLFGLDGNNRVHIIPTQSGVQQLVLTEEIRAEKARAKPIQ